MSKPLAKLLENVISEHKKEISPVMISPDFQKQIQLGLFGIRG